MTDFRERYKRIGFGRENLDVNRALRSQRRDEARREMRSEHFSLKRDLESHNDSLDDPEHENKIKINVYEEEPKKSTAAELESAILKRLEKWKEERIRQKVKEKKKAKPPFKVGVVHHRIYSPPLTKNQIPSPPAKLCKLKEIHSKKPVKKVTRATEKRLAIKAVTNQQKRENMRSKQIEKVKANNKTEANQAPLAPKDHQFKAPEGITSIPLFGRQTLEACKNNVELHSKNILYTSNEFAKNVSSDNLSKNNSLSESVIPSINHSLVSSKSSNRHSNIKNFNIMTNDFSVNKTFNDSINDSSVEAVILNMSTDDQEILNDQENIDSNDRIDYKANNILDDHEMEVDQEDINSNHKKRSYTIDNSFSDQNKKKKRTSKISTPPLKSNLEDETKMNEDIIENDTKSLSNRFSKEITIQIKDKDRSLIDTSSKDKTKLSTPKKNNKRCTNLNRNFNGMTNSPSFTLEDKEMHHEAFKENETINRSMNRRSSRLYTNTNVSIQNPAEKDNYTLKNQEISNEQGKIAQVVIPKQIQSTKKSLKRESIKNFTLRSEKAADEISLSEEMKTTELGHKTLENKKDVDQPKNTSLSDVPISKQIETKSHSFRRSRIINNGVTNIEKLNKESSFTINNQDEMIDSNGKILRNKILALNVDSPEECLTKNKNLSLQKSVSKKETVKNTNIAAEQSSKKFLSVKQKSLSFNEGSLELTKKRNPETLENNVQNLSLNMSLVKDSMSNKPPAFFSPYIVTCRGKSSARKELQRRHSQISSEEIPMKDTVMKNLNISIEEEERTAQYYKYILNQEIQRLNEQCDSWNIIKENDATPEDIRYLIQAAVGQTQLLINKKFERFHSLVLDCETGEGKMLVTCKDLQGFWEMMYMEIRDCDNRFNKLDKLKANNWIEDQTDIDKVMQQPKKKKVTNVKKNPKNVNVAAKSSLRAHIMAARKKKMECKESTTDIQINPELIAEHNKKLQEDEDSKSSINISAKNSRRTSTPKSTNKWQSLLRRTKRLSQTRKSTTSPLIQMKLTQMCKTPEVQLDDSIAYINSDRTPAKGILKNSKDEVSINSVAKSTNKVFFKEQPMELECDNRVNSGEEKFLVDIAESIEPIERRLNFENDSFNSSHLEDIEEDKKEAKINHVNPIVSLSPFNVTANKNIPKILLNDESPLISMSPLSLEDNKSKKSMSKKNNIKIKKHISFMEDEHENYTRTLRSKPFSAPLTPKPKLKTLEEVEDTSIKENDGSFVTIPESKYVKELYLNVNGFICERIISAKTNASRTPKLWQSSSEVTKKNLKTNIIKESDNLDNSLSTPKSRRRNSCVTNVESSDPFELINEDEKESRKSTPAIKRKNLKRSIVNTTLTEDDDNQNGENILVPRLSRRKSKAFNISKNNIDSNESFEYESTTPKLRRKLSKSLNITKTTDTNLNKGTEESITPRLKRRNSNSLHVIEMSAGDDDSSLKEFMNLRSRLSKKQENIEPNGQEINDSIDDKIKVLRTSSIKRRNSKKYLKNVEYNKQTNIRKKVNETLTPNTRRKSSRRTHQTSIENED